MSGLLKNTGTGVDFLVKKYIENMKVDWALIDPLSLDDAFQICDGSAWKANTYASTYWNAKGIANIPDLRGYAVRAHDRGATNDADRATRVQAVTAPTVSTSSGTVITLPKYHINIINEALSLSRTVIIGEKGATIFTTLSVYGTVASVSLVNNTVTLTSITGSFTAGSNKSLIIKGDLVGSFQNHQFQGHIFKVYAKQGSGASYGWSGVANGAGVDETSGYTGSPITDGINGTPLYGLETHGKNVAYLPIMWVRLPSSIYSAYSDFTGLDTRIWSLPKVNNLLVKNNASNPNYQVDISFTGLKIEDQYEENFSATIDITQHLDTGAEANSTWYYIWLMKGLNQTTICRYSTSSTSPTMPVGYTKKLLISMAYNGSGGNFVVFIQENNKWQYSAAAVIKTGAALYDETTDCRQWIPEKVSEADIITTCSTLHSSIGTSNQLLLYSYRNGTYTMLGYCSTANDVVSKTAYSSINLKIGVSSRYIKWQALSGSYTAGASSLYIIGFEIITLVNL